MEALDNKCPSCGAVIKFSPKEQKWVCEYCGSEFTLEEMQQHKNASSEEVNQKSSEKKKRKDFGFLNFPLAKLQIILYTIICC